MEKVVVNANELADITMVSLKLNVPILSPGPPGVGKSTVFEFVADTWVPPGAKKPGVPLHHFHLVTSDQIDAKGMPTEVEDPLLMEKVWEFRPFGDLLDLIDVKNGGRCNAPCIAFLDDFGTATKSVQAAWMQIILAYKLGKYVIHPEVRFVMATNRAGDKSGADHGVLETIKGRSMVIPMDSSVAAWCGWATKNPMPDGNDHPHEAIGFARWVDSKSEPLFDFTPTKDVEINSCSPRNLTRLGMFVREYGEMKKDVPLAVMHGCIGPVMGTKFKGFLKVVKKLPTIKQIVDDPQGTKVPGDINLLYPLVGYLASKATPKNMKEVVDYVLRLPDEYRVVFSRDLLVNFPGAPNNTEYGRLVEDIPEEILENG